VDLGKLSPLTICIAIGISSAEEKSQTAKELGFGKSIEEQFTGGLATHSYQARVAAGQYARIIVEQREVDVVAHLAAPDGNPIARFDREERTQAKEEIEFVAEKTGEYRLEVKTKFNSAAGGYVIEFAELRDANENDRLLFEAQVSDLRANDLMLAGKYAEAAPFISRAVEVAEKQFGAADARVGFFLNHLGYLQRQQGNYAAAEATLQRALALNEKTLGPEHPQTIVAMQNLGRVFRSKNDYAKADTMYRQAIAMTEKTFGAEHPKIVQQLINFETVLAEMGDLERGRQILQRALAIAEKHFEPESETIADILNNIGTDYIDDKEYDRAEPYIRRALAIYEKTGVTDNDRYSNTLQNLGLITFKKSDYPQALTIYERTLAMREKRLGKDHLNLAPLLNNYANVYHAMGEEGKAMATLRRALALAEKNGGLFHSWTILSLRNFARYYAAAGDVTNAVAFQKLCDERTETALGLNLAIGSERQKFIQLDDLEERTSRTISLNVGLAPNESQASDLAALVLLQRKGRVLDAMSASFAALRDRAEVEDRKILDQLSATTEELAKVTLKKALKMSLDDQRKQISELTEKKETLEAEISRRSGEFRAASTQVTLEAVAAEIPAEAALVEFAVYRPYDAKAVNSEQAYGEPRYVAYVLRHSGRVQWKDLGERQAIDAAIEQWRASLGDPKRKDTRQTGRAVDEKIMRPIRELASGVKRFLISPDGQLSLIPFEALVDEKGIYLVQNQSFAYLTSGRDLLRMKIARRSKSKDLLIANPRFGESAAELMAANRSEKPTARLRKSITATRSLSDTYFAPLSGTLQEARSIQEFFPEAVLLTGPAATEAAVKHANAPRFLHVATHGYFLSEPGPAAKESTQNPLVRSGLALANANVHGADNSSGDDGVLTALEASGLNLWGTKLVVLSACDTGLGVVKAGEGVYGLRRAFVLAGAESLVMSLWSVSDYSTRRLMADYYKNLKKGQGRGAALREVQLGLLKNNPGLHPFYWANFIQIGDWANLDGER
jgi:CHAT domain-containing protein/Tfp pilus assembly protein PilF